MFLNNYNVGKKEILVFLFITVLFVLSFHWYSYNPKIARWYNGEEVQRAATTSEISRLDLTSETAIRRTSELSRLDLTSETAIRRTSEISRLDFTSEMAIGRTSEISRLDLASETAIGRTSEISRLDLASETAIGRMLYSKPETFRPPRTDVLMLTPWLAPIIWDGGFNIDILNAQFQKRQVRVGITVFAVKKYTVFVKAFLETAEKYLMVGHKVNYYIFTDRPNDILNITLPEGRQMITLEIPSYKRWQEVSMRRMEMIRDHTRQRFIHEVDYLVCVDVDMMFSDSVGVEILSDVFGTLHPGFYNANRQHFTYERRPASTAYIPSDEGDFYYAGGYFGGTVEEVYKLTNFCHNAMMTDKGNNIEAIWHDESYLNKYFLYHKPTKILSPEYLWVSAYNGPNFLKKRRFIALAKNHNAIRNKRSLKEISNSRLKFHLGST